MNLARRHLSVSVAPAALALLLGAWVPPPAHAQITPLPYDQGGMGLGLALRHLGVDGGLLYVTAHPDDENNGALVKYQRGLGIPTALLTVTRGDGGQNEIGPELFQALGILRTEELAGVHRYDGARQYFTRAFEFGYSFSVEETFEKWGREEILRDVVRVIRTVRPDVILTMHSEGPGGGQHHQTTARLAHEAFRVAADPTRFPEQIEQGLRPWQARKVYQSVGGFGGRDCRGRRHRRHVGLRPPAGHVVGPARHPGPRRAPLPGHGTAPRASRRGPGAPTCWWTASRGSKPRRPTSSRAWTPLSRGGWTSSKGQQSAGGLPRARHRGHRGRGQAGQRGLRDSGGPQDVAVPRGGPDGGKTAPGAGEDERPRQGRSRRAAVPSRRGRSRTSPRPWAWPRASTSR